MQDNKEQTNLTNPPKGQTEMVAGKKKVKIKALHPIRIMDGKNEIVHQPGTVLDVSSEDAEEFCDKEFDLGYRDAFGYSDPIAVKTTKLRRAVRVV